MVTTAGKPLQKPERPSFFIILLKTYIPLLLDIYILTLIVSRGCPEIAQPIPDIVPANRDLKIGKEGTCFFDVIYIQFTVYYFKF